MKFCPKCGKHYKDSTKFCSDCGVELNQGAEGASNFTNSIEEAGAAAKSALNNALSEENREKAKAAFSRSARILKCFLQNPCTGTNPCALERLAFQGLRICSVRIN